eukprot:tig00021318_g20169.t1
MPPPLRNQTYCYNTSDCSGEAIAFSGSWGNLPGSYLTVGSAANWCRVNKAAAFMDWGGDCMATSQSTSQLDAEAQMVSAEEEEFAAELDAAELDAAAELEAAMLAGDELEGLAIDFDAC